MKHILHLANDYHGSSVYKSLVQELDALGVMQSVYSPVIKTAGSQDSITRSDLGNFEVIAPAIRNKYIDRLFYPYKVLKFFSDIQSRIDFQNVDYIHAHTWYSDGAVAYLLFRKFGIPYTITVRGTDINVFHKWMVYLRPWGAKILKAAKRITVVSAAHHRVLANLASIRAFKKAVLSKSKIVPNGISNFWVNNIPEKGYSIHSYVNNVDTFNVLFVGKLSKNKRVYNLAKAVLHLKELGHANIFLHIVGSGGDDEVRIVDLCGKSPDSLRLYGKIRDKHDLRSMYLKASVFAMPSQSETFGLVYLEALSCGCPLLYTRGQGIDGAFDEEIGESVVGGGYLEIAEKLQQMMSRHSQYQIPLDKIRSEYTWSAIAKKYFEYYIT